MRLVDADNLIEKIKQHEYCKKCLFSDKCYIADESELTCEKLIVELINQSIISKET